MSTHLAEIPRTEMPVSLFEIPGCHFSAVGLDIEPGMKFEHWERLVRSLERAEQGIQWYLGDALNYGEMEYGEKYAQVVDAHEKTGIPINTLKNYQWVAGHIPKVRRLTSVSWSAHQEVAALLPAKQTEWLSQAQTEHLTSRELRKRVERAKGFTRTAKTVKADADLQAHIERTVFKIENEIKPDCPDSDFIRRHYDSWLDDLRFELQERAIVEAQDKILEAWEYGNRTDIELQKATGFTKGVIGQVLGRLGWEKIRQGGKTDAARGDRPWIWHKPGEATGSDAQIPRSIYQNGEVDE